MSRPIEIQYATILMIITGGLVFYLGYQTYQFSIMISEYILAGLLMPLYGILTLCASLLVWFQKPWATIIIAGIGGAVIGTLCLFGYYLFAIILFLPLYGVVIKWVQLSID